MGWEDCPDVERIPGKVSGAWLVKGTRVPVWAILEDADDLTPEEIVAEVYPNLSLDTVRRVIAFAKGAHAPSPP